MDLNTKVSKSQNQLNFRDTLANFYKDNYRLFETYNNFQNSKDYLDAPIMILGGLAFATLLNVNMFGAKALIAYVPAFSIFLSYFILRKLYSFKVVKHASTFLTAGSFSISLGALYMTIIGGEITFINAPLQITLILSSLLARLPTMRQTLGTFLLNIAFVYGIFYVYHPSYLGLTLIQPISCFFVGVLLVRSRFNERVSTFYSQESNIQQKLMLHRQLRKKVYPHQLSRISTGEELEDTMPVGTSNVCVLKFDTVGSSNIKHTGYSTALFNFDVKCQDVLMQNYTENPLAANGYRLKGTGDGLITIHGFPFSAPAGYTPASLSIMVAEKFLELFDQEMQTLNYNEPILGSVAVATGEIRGFHVKGLVVEYDMSGRPIILADRYESFRKDLFPEGLEGNHIITIQEDVFLKLPQEVQSLFTKVSLAESHKKIRNDAGAENVYYRKIPSKQTYQKS